jgi:hypothetical protein
MRAKEEEKMARFCSNCVSIGAPVSGQFCGACGAAIKEGAAQAQNVTPPAAPVFQPVAAPATVGKSSGAKILLIVLSSPVQIADVEEHGFGNHSCHFVWREIYHKQSLLAFKLARVGMPCACGRHS